MFKLATAFTAVIGAAAGFGVAVSPPVARQTVTEPVPTRAAPFGLPQAAPPVPMGQMAGVACYLPGNRVVPLTQTPWGWWTGSIPQAQVIVYKIMSDPDPMTGARIPLWKAIVTDGISLSPEWASGAGWDGPTPSLIGHYGRLVNPIANSWETVTFAIR